MFGGAKPYSNLSTFSNINTVVVIFAERCERRKLIFCCCSYGTHSIIRIMSSLVCSSHLTGFRSNILTSTLSTGRWHSRYLTDVFIVKVQLQRKFFIPINELWLYKITVHVIKFFKKRSNLTKQVFCYVNFVL